MQTLNMKYIEIDSAHRIPDHQSKCKNIHGHRYRIEAYYQGNLHTSGPQKGMSLDFSFVKEEMIKVIDEPCDHGLILCKDDPFAMLLMGRDGIKLYLLDDPPTAEVLAWHWCILLAPRIKERSSGQVTLVYLRVWETPTCFGQYPATQVLLRESLAKSLD